MNDEEKAEAKWGSLNNTTPVIIVTVLKHNGNEKQFSFSSKKKR